MRVKILALGLMITATLFNSCSNDSSNKPKFEFVGDSHTISLKGAKFYLTHDQINNNRDSRDYFITDGTYTNSNLSFGWNFSDYDDATYYVGIQLGSPVDGTLTVGDFEQHSVWANAADEISVGYITVATGTGNSYVEYYTEDDNEDSSPIEVSGGLEDGDQITLQFEGVLNYYYFDGGGWVTITSSGRFYFSGTIQDVR